jgi:triphosphatase
MSNPRETELKLELPAKSLEHVGRNALLNTAPARPQTKKIVSVYFDTGKFKLRKSGFTLRVRRENRHRMQTVKQGGERAALLARNEWEQPIRGIQPDLKAARQTGLKPLLTKKLARRLKPVFETAVRRTTYPLRNPQCEIELSVDKGKVAAGRKSSALCEMELELKRGTTADMFALAQSLAQDLPVQLSVRTKAERGYQLLEGKQLPVKALPVPLTPESSAQTALQAVARACLHQIIANRPLIRIGKPEGLHQTRVAVRRLRAAFSLFSPMLVDSQTYELKAELRWLSGELGSARELDVFIGRVVKPLADGRRGEPGLTGLLKDLRQRRNAAYARVHSSINSFRFRQLMLAVASWIEIGEWTRNGNELAHVHRQQVIAKTAADELQRRRKKIFKRGRHLTAISPERRHKMRIQAKKVRYAAEFFADAFPGKKSAKRRAAFIAALEKLQDALGELNDIGVHEELSAGLAQEKNGDGSRRRVRAKMAFAAGLLSGHQEARMQSAMAEAERAYRVFARVKPFWR